MCNRLSERLSTVLREIWDGGPYALVDYPLYNNPGDAAIWWGTRIVLEEIAGEPPVYVSDLRNFDAAKACAKIKSGTVFFLGGGNFGGLYPKHHRMRLASIAALKGIRVVCLPLSVAGLDKNDQLLRRTRDVLAMHGNVTLIAREKLTQCALLELLATKTDIAPDAAHAIPFSKERTGEGLLRLIRKDIESTPDLGGEKRIDWADLRELRRLNRWGKVAMSLTPGPMRLKQFDRLAQRRVSLALCRLSAARTIETNRLHAAIFAASLGRELIIHDNMTGKIASYVETWGLLNKQASEFGVSAKSGFL